MSKDYQKIITDPIAHEFWTMAECRRAHDILKKAEIPNGFGDWLRKSQPDNILARIFRGQTDLIELIYMFIIDQIINDEKDVVVACIKTKAFDNILLSGLATKIDYDLSTDGDFIEMLAEKLEVDQDDFDTTELLGKYFDDNNISHSPQLEYILNCMEVYFD